MPAMKLYDLELSGNCYKVRLLLSILKLDYTLVPVDFMAGEHKSAPMLAKNPLGEIPVFEDGNLILRDSQAILVYLASQYDNGALLPQEPAQMAQVMAWLMVAENEIARGPNDARLHDLFGFKLDVNLAREKAQRILQILEQHLESNQWLAQDQPTIADIACFPCVAIGHEGGVQLTEFPAVRAWIERIKALPGFIGMPGL